jgi:UrcA family protein
MMRVLSLGVVALGVSLAFPAVADPRSGDQLRTEKVQLSDLNLRTDAGATAAVRRLSMAARTVCDQNDNSTRDLGGRMISKHCRQSAMDVAVASLGAPLVTATYAGSAPTRLATARHAGQGAVESAAFASAK